MAKKKKLKKKIEEKFEIGLGKLIENIDPLELAAFVGASYISYIIIDASDEILEKILAIIHRIKTLSQIETWISLAKTAITLGLVPAFYPAETAKGKPVLAVTYWMKIALSITLAFIIIRHGWQIIGAMGGIAKIALAFL